MYLYYVTLLNNNKYLLLIMSKGKSIIAENIKKYRNKIGISQDVLSKKANLVFHMTAK